jgi:RNA polymerase sigma-70 factor (ECF subfamily)
VPGDSLPSIGLAPQAQALRLVAATGGLKLVDKTLPANKFPVTFPSKVRLTMSRESDTVGWVELIQAAREGDDGALNEIWRQLRLYLLIFADQRLDDGLRGKLDASDLVQQSLLEAHRDFSEFRGQSESELRSWISRLVVHNLSDAGRRFRQSRQRNVAKEVVLSADAELSAVKQESSASSIVRRRETDDQLMRAVAELPERSQQIVELRHRLGLSHAEIGRELGMTEAAARKLWSRIVEELQERLASGNVERSTKPQ